MRCFPVSREVKRTKLFSALRTPLQCAGRRSVILFLALACASVMGADDGTQQELRELRKANSLLQEQLSKQQQVIDSLSSKVASIEQTQKSRDELAGETPAAASLAQKLSG